MRNNIFLSAFLVFFLSISFSFAEPDPSVPSQGLVIGMENGLLVVQKVYLGSAGYEAGIQEGDTFLAIGDMTTAGMTPRDLGYALDFNPGSTVGIALIRGGVTKFLYLNRKNPLDQWNLAWDQDRKELLAKQQLMASQRRKTKDGELVYGPGQISYATSEDELDAMDSGAGGPGVWGMKGKGSGGVTYEMLYEELMRLRKQLMKLNHSVDNLTEKVESVRPESSKDTFVPPAATTDDINVNDFLMEDTTTPKSENSLQNALTPSPLESLPSTDADIYQPTTKMDMPKEEDDSSKYFGAPRSMKTKPANAAPKEVPPTSEDVILQEWLKNQK